MIYLVVRYGITPGKLLLKMRITMIDGAPVTVKAAILRDSVAILFMVLMTIGITMGSLEMTDTVYYSLKYVERKHIIKEMAPWWYNPTSDLFFYWCILNLIVIVFQKQHRAIHDFIGGTVVIRPEPAEKIAGL